MERREPGVVTRLYVEEPLSPGATITLDRDRAHYLKNVLRAAAGQTVGLFNGRDGEWRSRIVDLARHGAVLSAEARTRAQAREPDLWLVFAPVKRARIDFIAEKATELGVSAILPFAAERSIAGDGRVERWRRIAESAAAQSGRVRTPRIELVDFPGALSAARSSELRLLLWERSETPLPREAAPRSVFLVTGPEGGFSTEEVALATDAGFRVIGLGPRILRAETAAVAAVTLAGLFWGDLGDG